MTNSTRNPTTAPVNALRVGGMVGVVGVLLGELMPGVELATQQAITAAVVALSGCIGKEIRNYQHTFSPGEKRADIIQGGLSEVILGILGRVL